MYQLSVDESNTTYLLRHNEFATSKISILIITNPKTFKYQEKVTESIWAYL